LVESIGFLIVLFFIFFDCAFDYVNGFLLVRFRMRWEETARKSALDIVGKERRTVRGVLESRFGDDLC
jgi:hypothetical protein